MDDYKIELGVKLDTSDLQTQINNAGKDIKPIDIKVDAETKELTKTINDALKSLSKGSQNTLSLDTTALENSLREVKDAVVEIRNLFGTIDDKSGMKSLLSSVNQMATTIGKVTDETDTLVKSLNALNKKDFNINLGIDMNKKGLNAIGYGRAARKQVIPELESQIKYLEDLFGGQQATMNRLASQGSKIGFDVFTDFGDFNSDTAIRKMEAMEKYINSLKKLAAIDNVNLDGFNEKFSKGATELINDITGIENAVDKAGDIPQKLKNLFGSGVDGEGLSKQLDSIVVDLNEIKTAIQGLSSGVSLDGLTQSFDRLSETIEQLVKNCTTVKQVINDSVDNVGKSVGQSGSDTGIKETSNELKKLKDLAHQIGQLDFKIVKSNYNDEINQVKEFERQLELLKTQYNETLNSLNGKDLDIGSEITKEFTEARNKIAEFEAKVSDTKRKLAEDIKTNIGNNITKDINKVHSDFNRLSTQSEELRQKLDLLDNIKIDLDTAAANNDIEGLITANERYEKVLKDIKAQLDINRRTERDANDVESLTLGKENAMLRLKSLFGDNSEAARKFGSELNRIQKELDECGDAKGLQRINKEITNLGRKVKEANVQTQTFDEKLKNQFSQYSSYLSIASLYMYVEQGLRSMFEQVKLIDSAMTELKKVTNETDAAYNKFLTNAATRSREIGTTIDGLVSSTADFARLGYGFEDAQGLAEVANIYAVVGDEINGVEGATESLISTMAAFKNEMNGMSNTEFAMSIIDKFNEIGNNFAISSGGIGEAMERSASSLMAANNTIDESIALITAANTVVQDPAQVGTAFKTISMRIRGAKTELEEAGLETEGMVESTAKLRSEILALSGVDIMENANEFKSTYQIMDELAQKWGDLTDIQQATVTELIAGKRQGNIVSSLMTNFDTARDALETSLNSAGSAMVEHEKWQQSLEAQINKLKASWQGLSQAFLKSDFLHTALDGIISLVDGVTKLIDTFGTLPTLLTGFTIFKSFGNKGLFKTFNNDLDGFVNKVGIANKSFAELTSAFKSANTGGFKGFVSGLKSMGDALAHPLSQSDLSAIESYNKLIDDGVDGQTAFAQTMKGTSNAAQGLVQSANGSKVALNGMKTASIGVKAGLIGAKVAAVAFNAALTMGISLLIDFAISGIQKLANAKKDLAESVDELTSKFKEQHNELIKLKGDYDTSNESSMISKYEKLSKGVDNLGRNVSLTAEEYSEYQSIVNSIAEQIPSLVSGYDDQGNAILSCKGNVEELITAYQKLIHVQNQEILTNTGNIEKDFTNNMKDANKQGFWKSLIAFSRGKGGVDFGSGLLGYVDPFINYDMTTDATKSLEDLLNSNSKERSKKIKDIYENDYQTFREIESALERAGVDVGFGKNDAIKALEKTLETDPTKIRGIVDDFYGTFSNAIEEQKTIATAKLSEAFDVGSAISGLNYGDISEELQAIAYQTVNSLDYDFFSKLSESGKTVEQWTTEMLNQLNAISKADNAKIEAGFELQTKFNGGEISYGEYVNNLKNVESIIDDLNLKSEAKEQLKISLGLDDNGVIDQYNALVKRLTDPKNYDFDISKTEAKKLLDGLSSEELAVAVDVITEMSDNNVNETIDQVRDAIDRELTIQGLTLDLNIETETGKLESLATALSETASASGLSAESLSAVEGMFSDLSSYDPSKLFERTASGIRLNTEEFRRLNTEYKNTNIDDLNKEMDALGDAYNQTKEELYGLTYGTDEYNAKATELSGIEERIRATEKLAAQYEGLASAYQEWQMVEAAGSQRDMYEGIIEGFENIDDEISRGWYDDGTIEFLELLGGKDLSTAGIKELKAEYKRLNEEIGKTGYSIRDFFTVDEDGNSTNGGVYNFLRTVEKFEGKLGDVIERKDGKIVGFDFQVAGGDEAIAEALGISEELVQIMVRAADDAGFVVSMDGTYQQLDILKEKAAEAALALKETFKVTEYAFFQDGSEEGIVKDYQEALKVWESFKKNKNKDGTVNMSVEGAEEAFTLISTLQSMVDQLSEPVYMELDTSDVEKEMQTPLKNLQQYETLLQTEHQLKLKGADTSGLEEDKEEILDYFEGLSPEIKADLGIKDNSREEIAKKLEDGTIEIPATVDLQVEMNETLRDMVNVALYNAGLIDDKELETRVDISVYAEKVDTSDVEDKTEKAVKEAIEDKGEEAVAVETTVELEATIEEATELIEKFEDKDITIDVKVKGLNDVKKLNKQIDLATDIDGNVDKLSKYVESAKTLSGLDDNIASYVSANVKGNVIETPEYKINNLKVFADSVKDLEDVGSFTSNVKADVKGNVIETPEYKLNNLKVFTDSAKNLDDIGSPKSEVTAEIKGNVTNTAEFKLNNLKVFTDNAKDIGKIGDVQSNVTANIKGNVTDTFEHKINNLKVFSDSAKGLKDIGSFKSEVTAEVKGNVTDEFEYKINNLKVFSDSIKDLKNIGNIKSEVTANVDGNVIDEFEYKINNLKVLTDSAKDLKDVGDVSSNIVANVDGDVLETAEFKLDNLKLFSDSAKDLKSIGSPTSNVTANIEGNVIGTKEFKLNNLKVFADGANKLKDTGSVESNVAANVSGNVLDEFEYKINNLGVFVDGAKDLKEIGNVESSVTANVDGNIIDTFEYKINNLKTFSDSAKDLKNLGNITSKVTADVEGNVINTLEEKIDNLKVFYDSAKNISKIGTINSIVTADVDGNVINTSENKLNNLKVFSDSAKDLKSIGSPTSKVTANVEGNVINTLEEKIDNLGVFADNTNKLKNTGDVTSNVTANANGNVVDGNDAENRLSSLTEFKSLVSGMSNQTVTVSVTANVDSANINNAIDLLTNLNNSGVFKDYNATVQVGATIATIDDTTVKNYKAPEKEGKVKYSVDPESSVFTWTAPNKDGVVNYDAKVEALTNSQKYKTGTITYKAKVEGFPVATGTAHANGSASGRAFARGNWGIKGNGVALGGELGQELVVRNGRFFTIGDQGAEFFRYRKNDIVFNAAQTESLFKYGGIKGANPRGKMLATGTAFAEGLAFGGSSSGSGGGADEVKGSSAGSNSSSNNNNNKNNSNNNSSSNADEFKETLDWIEIALSRIEREIDRLDKKANSSYKSWSERNSAVVSEIGEVGDEIELQQSAYDRYMQEANSVGLSESWAKKVRDGSIDISTIEDEGLAKKIKEYQEWYEKALDCQDAIDDLREKEAQLYAQRFENVQGQYDGILQGYEHTETMLNEYINQSEAQGHIVSKNYYNALIDNEEQKIGQLKKEQLELLNKRQEYYNAMIAQGMTDEEIRNSEAWLDMCADIDSTTQAIEEGTTALIEYGNAIRDIEWETFDMLQEKISNVTEEADFLIDLMSNDKLYDDNGKLTDEGMATMGLHGQNYNTYMHQADYYGAEAAKIDAELAKDPYNQDLLNRRDEMLRLQRESILAAEDEKQAIVDMVEEGINVELDALQERIDKYNESLDAAKDLYEYNKRVKEQTKEIASLEKQMAAYAGDDSEESKAKIQEIKVSLEEAKADLEETEYDKYISDQKALLDELYLEYETVLNQRLDNTDALIADVVAEVNANGSTISSTISTESENVGYTMSESMREIWCGEGGTNSIITMYGTNFSNAQTTTNQTLGRIEEKIADMVKEADKEAQEKIEEPKTQTSANEDPVKPTVPTKPTKPAKPDASSGGDGKAKVGDKVKFVSGQYYYDSYGTKPIGSQERGNYVYITYVNEKGSHPYHISRDKANKHPLGWLKLSQISGYATGKKNFLDDEIAWTQEKGKEFIVRPSDGAILTPLAKGDSVLNANASNNIWDMANSPAEFIKDNLNLGTASVPNNSNVQSNYTQHIDNVVFRMDNIKNYEEMLSAMQRDKNFERLILSMSIDRLAGKSGLAKGKAIR